jgi:hypothetical protein
MISTNVPKRQKWLEIIPEIALEEIEVEDKIAGIK